MDHHFYTMLSKLNVLIETEENDFFENVMRWVEYINLGE